VASEARKIVESVLGDNMTAKVWTSNYARVFPFNPSQFSVGALLPMILYLFRWGHRRGRGKLSSTAFLVLQVGLSRLSEAFRSSLLPIQDLKASKRKWAEKCSETCS
jgi:hypothetical protein